MYEELTKILKESDNIVFFGGAGVSTESDIPDFRSEQGLYNAQQAYGMSPEQMISHSFFLRDTDAAASSSPNRDALRSASTSSSLSMI